MSIKIEIELIEDSDLIGELQLRGYVVHGEDEVCESDDPDPLDSHPLLMDIYEALAARNEARALELTRNLVCDATGRIL